MFSSVKTDNNVPKNDKAATGAITRPTLYTCMAVSFVLGFLSGVVLFSYKAASLSPVQKGQMPHAQSSPQEMEKMVRALEQETAQHPENTRAWIQLGNIHFDHEENEKAIRAYEKALSLDPGNADVLTDLGVVYRRAGQPQKAIENFDKAVKVDAAHKTARFNKGVVLMHDLNDKAGAIRVWKELVDADPLFTAPGGQFLDEIIRHYEEHE